MTYSATYDSADASAIAIDGVGTFGVEAIQYMGLIVLFMLAGWFLGKTKQIRKSV